MSDRGHVLVARLDSMGDVLICGPAVRAVAAQARRVTMLVGPKGASAARLLPGVDDVVVWNCPWIAAPPPPVDRRDIDAVIARLAATHADEALVLTSYHQTALPTAMMLRLAGVARVSAVSEDYPGALLDVRIAPPADGPEPRRMTEIAAAAGFPAAMADDGRLQIRMESLPPLTSPDGAFVVVHPGADAPAREYPYHLWRAVVALLTAAGHTVAVTGSGGEVELTAAVASGGRPPGRAVDLGGCLDLAALAATLHAASVLLVGNTGPAHLAAAVGTPVVSLFAPVVSSTRWAPHGVASVVLGDESAPCAMSGARHCPAPGHPCLSTVLPAEVAAAGAHLAALSNQEVLA
jgi:ADP-heptose:LPS heptosyltransferase